jgi:hypothetical protein
MIENRRDFLVNDWELWVPSNQGKFEFVSPS